MRSKHRAAMRLVASTLFTVALASCGGGGGGVPTPVVEPPPDVTTNAVDQLVVAARYEIDDTAAERYQLRIEIANFGSARFVGNDSARWAFYEGTNPKKVPSSRFDPLDQTHGAAVFSGSLADVTIEPGDRVELNTDSSRPELDHGTYFGGCIEEDASPVYENCRRIFQYDATEDEIYQSGSRRDSDLVVSPVLPEGIDVEALALLEAGEIEATIYLSRKCDVCNESVDENSYQVIAYDPEYDEFAAGERGDVISFSIPSNSDIDLFGVPDNDTWTALTTGERGSYDPSNAVTALFFNKVIPKPSQMAFCIVTGEGNEILDCSATFVEGYVGPPVCADGFAKQGTSEDNRTACDELAQAQGFTCEAEFVGSIIMASSETVVEVGTSLHVQGCGNANKSITISLSDGEPNNPNTVSGPMCSSQTNTDPAMPVGDCLLSNPVDGSYDITVSYNQCSDPIADGELEAVTSDDERVASLDIASFCD